MDQNRWKNARTRGLARHAHRISSYGDLVHQESRLNQDPRCKELEEFLRTLPPRQELVRRWALGQLYPACQRDATWSLRVSESLAMLAPYDEDELAALMIAAREVAAALRAELGHASFL
jgi:hypothetical protein